MSKINKVNLVVITLMLGTLTIMFNAISLSAADTVPPKLLPEEDKPVKFDYLTRILTLDLDEPIDAVPSTDVKLNKIYIMNYTFDEDGNVVINVDSVTDLQGAVVTEGEITTVTITLTPEQRDILKSDHPQLYLDEGAVKDLDGNLIIALGADGIDNDGDGLTDEGGIEDIEEGDGDDDIDAANVYVTPLLLSGVESVYYGNLQCTTPECETYPEDYHKYSAVLKLKFTEDIGEVDATKITVTNEADENPFTLTLAEFDSIAPTPESEPRIARFYLTKSSKTSHRATISYWQRDEDITELHIKLGAGAVRDVNGNYNELMELSERIYWSKDTEGPRATDASSYSHATKLLKLRFDECIDLESDNIDNLVDLGEIELEAYNGDLAGDSFTLNEDEDVIEPGQETGVYLSITLSDNHRDRISSWDFAGGTQFILKTSTGAVHDIVGNTNPNYSGGYPRKNWAEDTVRPTFVSPAFYSIDEEMLVLRFSEPIYDGDIAQYKPDLSKIRVHAAGKDPVSLGDDARYDVLYDALKITHLSDDAHEAIAKAGNPQVDILDNAVYDLARNSISMIDNRPIVFDEGGPELSATGNTYEHISLENDTVNYGLLTLTFDGIVDVSTITDLAKIKLAAGANSVNLGGSEVLTETNAETINIKITDDDTVGEIVSWQDDYDTLFVELEEGAIRDLFNQANVAINQTLDFWIKKVQSPFVPESDRASEQNPIYGLNGKFYNSPDDVRSLEDAERVIAAQEPLLFSPVGPIDFPVGMQEVQWEYEGDPFGLGEEGYNYVVVFHGYIYSPTAGEVHFALGSDDGCRLTIAGYTVLEYPAERDFDYREGTATFEESGWYSIEIIMFQHRDNHGIEFRSNLTVDGDYDDPSELPLVPSAFLSPIVPVRRGDMSGDGTISAFDAALLLQYVVGLLDEFPVDRFTAPSSATPRNYAVSMPDLRAHNGSRVRVPVQIEDATDLTAGGFRIAFDPTRLRPTAMVNSPLLSDYYIRYNLQLRGEVRVAFAGLPKAKKGGILFYLEFDVLGKQDDNQIPLRFASVELTNSLNVFTRDGTIEILPEKTVLLPNYPNPFNPETWIPYQLSEDAEVVVRIYDVTGRLVHTLQVGHQLAGFYLSRSKAAYWNGRNALGESVANGVYFYTLQAGNFIATRRMVIVK